HRPPVLQALSVREAEQQGPAVGDCRTIVGDDDVGAEAITAFPALGVGDLAGRRLCGRRGRIRGTEREPGRGYRRPCVALSRSFHRCLLVVYIGGAARSPRVAPPHL